MTSLVSPSTPSLSSLITRPLEAGGFGPPPASLPSDAIRLLGGVPADEALPVNELAAAFAVALASPPTGARALQYSVAPGIETLREWIAARESDESVADPDRVVVTNGALHGLSLVFAALLDPGDLVAVESPTFPVALRVLDHYGAQLLPVPNTGGRVDLDVFESHLQAGRIPKLFYVIPDFHNPTGTTLAAEDRLRLVALAERYGFVVVSDNPYRELRFRGTAVPDFPLDSDRVVRVNTFSKTLGPGLRLGWAVAPTWLQAGLLRLRANLDQHASLLTQSAVAHLLDRPGLFDGIVANARTLYRERADLLSDVLTAEAGDLMSIPQAEGGIFAWVTVTDPDIDLAEVRAAANALGADFSSGRYFDPAASGLYARSLRLGFTNQSEGNLRLGAQRIARAVREVHSASRR
ncbi:PLP-dependent aminotransferase family protein [Rhodococcus pseudokoreensis]|uniref:PLP-dependent aminotransferase family protein n=1 Tax=Rhodococcus pseudokoreensis TaxID=2811421 RepID=A0A974WBM5_9NOCA|nr:PLP-dependent aminotransferase family protein [Rhodococcus pseudokoreensis]QSE94876.1 PLP-dependent aminotransferase family protein [Rhodococcus pseudokoreensis]